MVGPEDGPVENHCPRRFQTYFLISLAVSRRPNLDGGRALLAGGGRGQGGGGLDEGGGHLRRHRGGGARRAAAGGHVAHQPHAAVHPDVGVALGGHVEHLEAVVVEAGELALVGPLPVVPADRDGGLRVEDGQLPPWYGREEEEGSGC